MKRGRTMTCKGIGTGSQSPDWDVEHAISLGTGRVGAYTEPELPESNTPGILGRHSLRRRRTLIDTFNNVLYMVGPGGYELRLSPGSEKYDCVDSSMGHMMLPCSTLKTRGIEPKRLAMMHNHHYDDYNMNYNMHSPQWAEATQSPPCCLGQN